MGPTRLDHQIFACLCTGIEFDRDTMALHDILLGTVFSVCFFLMFIRGGCTDSYSFWYRLYDRLSGSIEYTKAYVHLLNLNQQCLPSRSTRDRLRPQLIELTIFALTLLGS